MKITGELNKTMCEYLRTQSLQRFQLVQQDWIDYGSWVQPHRITWLQQMTDGARNNRHIVDTTHITALRSYVAGFLEGNTSTTRPWYRIGTGNPEIDSAPENHAWLEKFTQRTLHYLASGNFYFQSGIFYGDYGTFNTGAHLIDELPDGRLFFHTLDPGSYYVLNNDLGEAVVMVREFCLTVQAIISRYGKKVDGKYNWDNFSPQLRELYEQGHRTEKINITEVIAENEDYDASEPIGFENRPWVMKTYETGSNRGQYMVDGSEYRFDPFSKGMKDRYLRVSYRDRKPFILGKSVSTNNFEYGQKGPTSDALGLIKSLNKKALSKDQALEQILRPTLQGPAHLNKSYLTSAPNRFVPLDAHALAGKGVRPIFEINPAIGALIQDVDDIRKQVDNHYYADFLLFLSKNPKTRTAEETRAIVEERQLIIGPNLQSLNYTYNVPIVDYVMHYVLHEDPYLEDPPEQLQGEFLRPQFISVFAQAQRAADLPNIDRYVNRMLEVGSIDQSALDKVNLDKLADLYEDRLYLPSGLNNPQSKVEAIREQRLAMQQRAQEMEMLTQATQAAKNVGVTANNQGTGE